MEQPLSHDEDSQEAQAADQVPTQDGNEKVFSGLRRKEGCSGPLSS